MTNPEKEPKEISAKQKAEDQRKAFEEHQRKTEAEWKNKSQKEKIDSLAVGFNRVFQGLDKVMEGQEILSNLNAANYHTCMAIVEALKLDKKAIVKRANEMWAADMEEQNKKVEDFEKKQKSKSKKNDISIPDKVSKA
jgi:hypothetical protein